VARVVHLPPHPGPAQGEHGCRRLGAAARERVAEHVPLDRTLCTLDAAYARALGR
jgi:hypothetical protein